ncbi:MAG: hypothetical protein JJE53_00415 [Candidatus Pacebacteria bacterium]|nr:hypothetical protein [Candidatus Paceibacterota bacterium]
MINNFIKINKQKGYAILFTVVIVSAISVITAGLSNTAYKQLVLSSLAKDSQTAFYQADSASDCGLYADRVYGAIVGNWTCAGENLVVSTTPTGYTVYPTLANGTSTDPCFRIDVTKTITGVYPNEITKTRISAKGYNICNKTNLRTVEREVVVNFSE